MQIDKNNLRHKYLLARNNLPKEEVKRASNVIFDKVLKTNEFLACRNVLLYASYNNEVITYSFFKSALRNGKNVYFPKCYDDFNMRFYKADSIDDLNVGMYGIYEPDECCEEYINSEDSLCIVPGICFDKKRYRLGYGKGYYDRFLCGFKGKTIGVVIDEFVVDELPVFYTDLKIDMIITDKNIYRKEE